MTNDLLRALRDVTNPTAPRPAKPYTLFTITTVSMAVNIAGTTFTTLFLVQPLLDNLVN